MGANIKFFGRIIVKMNIIALTGLHIGGSSAGMEIGGVDNPVIRDPLNNQPYIPGSSLRGKMRSQLEKALGLEMGGPIGEVNIHICKDVNSYKKDNGCPVCHIFGVPGNFDEAEPTRLVVRDVLMNSESAEKLRNSYTDLDFTEVKYEVTIDRITSAASPRNIERVPAGAVFGPGELVYSIYCKEDINRFKYVLQCLQLVEDDYLGGSGSRGSGKVEFDIKQVYARVMPDYAARKSYEGDLTVQQLLADVTDLQKWALNIFGLE